MWIQIRKDGLQNSIIVGEAIILCYLVFSFLDTDTALKCWEITMSILLLACFVFSIKRFGLLSEVTLFLISFALFLCVFPIEDIFGIYDFRQLKLISYTCYLTDTTAIKTVMCLTIGLTVVWVCINCFDYKKEDSIISDETQPFESTLTVVFILLVLASIPYKVYLAAIVQYGGYATTFTSLRTTGIIRLSEMAKDAIFPIFTVCFLCETSKKRMKIILIFFAVISILDLFCGRRATFFEEMLFIAWFLNKYISKLNTRKVGLFFLLLLFASAIMVQFRNGTDTYNLLNNGHSVYVISLTIDNAAVLNSSQCNEWGIPYTFGLLVKDAVAIFYKVTGQLSPFYDGQTLLTLQHSAYLGWELTYLLRPSSFLNGYGMGSSYVAEAYLSHGMIGIIFYTFLVFGIMKEAQKAKWKYGTAFYFVAVKSFFEIPRANFFNFLIELILTLIILGIFRGIIKLLTGRRIVFAGERSS